MGSDDRLTEAKALPIMEVAERLGIVDGLKRAGREWVGACPACGGTDRFSLAPDQDLFNCRQCGGGDQVALVGSVMGLDFRAALAWLVGESDVEISPEERDRREEQLRRQRADRDRAAERKREEAIASARAIWNDGHDAPGTPVVDYLALRGLTPELLTLPRCLKFAPALPYMAPDGAGGFVEVHRGPAMLAAIVAPDGALTGVHRTWIDLDRPGGKAAIEHGGEAMPAKKVWGSKKGGAIRLSTPLREAFRALVMGEGIETTASAMVADPVAGAAYWAGVDLGNMAGRRLLRGEGMKYAGVPDLEDQDAFLPPPWVERLVFIQDGDSDPKLTRAKLLSGLRRARHHIAGLTIEIVHAGDGVDLNDVLNGGDDADRED